jgi:hypothetical protein
VTGTQEVGYKIVKKSTIENEMGDPVHPFDALLPSLGLESIRAVDGDELMAIKTYAHNTNRHTDDMICEVRDVFAVKR